MTKWGLATAVAGVAAGAGCTPKPEPIPEPQQFALACPEFRAGWPPDSSAPLVILGGIADLRFEGDTVGWARPPWHEEEEEEEDTGFWESLLNSLLQSIRESLRDDIPLIAVPGAVGVLRWDLGTALVRAGFRVLDAAEVDSLPAGPPTLGGELRRIEAFYRRRSAERGDSLFALVALDLDLRGESPVPRWRRRFEAALERRQPSRPVRDDVELLVGQAWCDLLAQVEEAFRETEFSAAVREEP